MLLIRASLLASQNVAIEDPATNICVCVPYLSVLFKRGFNLVSRCKRKCVDVLLFMFIIKS